MDATPDPEPSVDEPRPGEPEPPTGGGGPDAPSPALRPLDPRNVAVERIGWLIFAAIVLVPGAAAVSLAVLFDWWAPWVLAIVAGSVVLAVVLILWTAWRWPPVEHRATSYRVAPAGIEIRKGVFWRKVINVPRSRVQHTDVTQSPLLRRYGLGALVVHTAGTHNAAVTLSGLAHADALAARDILTTSDGDDGV